MALASAADAAVVVVGTTAEVESEGYDRRSLALPGRQDELVRRVAAANPRTVVVVNAGPGGHALAHSDPDHPADLVPGSGVRSRPGRRPAGSGRTRRTAPNHLAGGGEHGFASTWPDNGILRYGEGLHIGYRRYLKDGTQPAYWFGHGLGYTEWEYGQSTVTNAIPTVQTQTQARTMTLPIRLPIGLMLTGHRHSWSGWSCATAALVAVARWCRSIWPVRTAQSNAPCGGWPGRPLSRPTPARKLPSS